MKKNWSNWPNLARFKTQTPFKKVRGLKNQIQFFFLPDCSLRVWFYCLNIFPARTAKISGEKDLLWPNTDLFPSLIALSGGKKIWCVISVYFSWIWALWHYGYTCGFITNSRKSVRWSAVPVLCLSRLRLKLKRGTRQQPRRGQWPMLSHIWGIFSVSF